MADKKESKKRIRVGFSVKKTGKKLSGPPHAVKQSGK